MECQNTVRQVLLRFTHGINLQWNVKNTVRQVLSRFTHGINLHWGGNKI